MFLSDPETVGGKLYTYYYYVLLFGARDEWVGIRCDVVS